MTDTQRKAILELLEYIDVTRGSIRFNFQDDGDIIAYPTPKIELSADCPKKTLDIKISRVYNIARIID